MRTDPAPEVQGSGKGIWLPPSSEIEAELKNVRYRRNFRQALRSTLSVLVTVSAAAILIAVLLLPVLQIYGKSMNPTLTEGDVVVTVKRGTCETGDIIAFYYNN